MLDIMRKKKRTKKIVLWFVLIFVGGSMVVGFGVSGLEELFDKILNLFSQFATDPQPADTV